MQRTAAGTLTNVSLAWGNVALADHGLTQPVEDLGTMPAPTLYAVATSYSVGAGGDRCNPAAPQAIPARFTPLLANAPLTQVGQVEQIVTFEGEQEATLIPFDPTAPAAAAMQWDSGNCLPAIHLTGTTPSGSTVWTARQDLLESHETDTDFVVEIDSDLIARLRFGDDEYALRPPAGTDFTAIYRVGNGVAGNVGAGSIVHVAAPVSGALPPGILTVTNPLPAAGGVDPESEDSVRMAAPQAFRVQERAVTAADWQDVSLRNPAVAQATADFRWTGSWLTVFDTVARPGAVAVDANFESTIASYLERYRVIGHDLQVNGPILVPLRIDLAVCVRPPWFRADVTRALRSIFGTGTLADGTPAFFNPARASFGETLLPQPDLCRRAGGGGRRLGAGDAVRAAVSASGRRPGELGAGIRAAGDAALRQRPELSGTRRAEPDRGGGAMIGSRRSAPPGVGAAMSSSLTTCCGGCAGVAPATPVVVDNPPGQPAIVARVGILQAASSRAWWRACRIPTVPPSPR